MEPNDGQRRIDAKDGYAPFEVRPAFRRDPGSQGSVTDAIVSVLALTVIGIVMGAVIWMRL